MTTLAYRKAWRNRIFFHLANKAVRSPAEYSWKPDNFSLVAKNNLRDVRQFNIVTALPRELVGSVCLYSLRFFQSLCLGFIWLIIVVPMGVYVYIDVSVSFLARRKSQIPWIASESWCYWQLYINRVFKPSPRSLGSWPEMVRKTFSTYAVSQV